MKYVFTLLFLFLFFSAHSQSIVYVTQNGAGNQSGASWSDALPGTQLQSRLASAGSGNQFWIAQGTYKPTTGTDRTISFSIPSGVQVYGGFSGSEGTLSDRVLSPNFTTILSGEIGNPTTIDDNSQHVITFRNATSTTQLDGVTVQYGAAIISTPDLVGGGIYNNGSSGGDSRPTIKNCIINQNRSANGGGGIFNNGYQGNASPTIINCQFTNNRSSTGGGVYNNGYQGTSNPTIVNCLFISNIANDGGAVYNEAFQGTSICTLLNCTFSKNSSNNTYQIGADTYSSAVIYNHGPQGNCNAILTNCIIWGNLPANRYLYFYSNPGVIDIGYSDIEGSIFNPSYSRPGNIDQDPMFVNADSNDFRLISGSRAINSGDSNNSINTSATDLAGNARIQQGQIDMGAYERQNNPSRMYVTPFGAGNRSGSSWANALGSDQWKNALVTSASGSTFWLSGGVYKPGVSRSDVFQIPSGVEVYGGFAGTEVNLTDRQLTNPSSTTLSGEVGDPNTIGDNNIHVVLIKNASRSTRLDGVVITGGNANANGSSGQTKGGGIYCDGTGQNNRSEPTITNCLLIKNNAINGGGLCNDGEVAGNASATISNCLFEQNTASTGGGVSNSSAPGSGSPTFDNCKFVKNVASSQGGGLYYFGYFGGANDNIKLTNCLFNENTAPTGGGLYCGNSFSALLNLTLTNCLFDRNRASNRGGAVHISTFSSSTLNPTLKNCVFGNNQATNGGGNLFADIVSSTTCNYTILNSIVREGSIAHSTDTDRKAPTYNVSYSNIQSGFAGTGNIDQDPLFVDAANGNYRLRAGSPSINTGDPNSTAATVSDKDLDGNARVAENRIDMGAYEFQVAAQTGSDLSLNLRVDNRAPALNQPVTYFLTVTNNGPVTATNVVWQNRLPDNLLFVGGSAINVSNNVLSGQIGSLAAGASTTFTYQLQPTQAAQYINAAQITASGQTDPDSQPNSGTGDGQDDAAIADFRIGAATGPVYTSANPDQTPLPAVQSNQPSPDPTKADLSLAMAVTNRSPKADEVVTISIQVDNAGGLTATGVASSLLLPNGVSFVSGNGFTASGQNVTGNFGSVGAGSSATLTCQVRIATGGNILFKAEVVACDQADSDSQPNSGLNDGQDDIATADLRVSQ